MPELLQSLLKQDIGHLRIIAEFWGVELESISAGEAREELSASLLDAELIAELVDSLSPQAESALRALVEAEGRIPWPAFTRKYGDIREMGAARRDRERPHLKPASTAEYLYYRGLLARAFFDDDRGPQEFAYIPEDLLEQLYNVFDEEPVEPVVVQMPTPAGEALRTEALGRPASPGEKGREIPADDSILDDVTTCLAALRMGMDLESNGLPLVSAERVPAIQSLLTAAKLIKKDVPQAEAIKIFLECPRSEALKMLQDAWIESHTFNELWLMPELICEGEWRNNPQETREFLLNLLDAIPEDKWWSLGAFVRDIKQKYADFQRPAGDYDSWFIKRKADGQYLRGFTSWEQVDGALVKYFITDVLHWLGQVDLSVAEGASEPTSFRINNTLVTGKEDQKVHISSQGVISIPRLAPRVVRYQISRFCDWDAPKEDVYRYRLSTGSLAKAKEQGLKVEHLLTLLSRHSDAGVPPTLVKALKRWEVNGTEARLQTQVILKVSRPEVLEEMRRSKAAKFLGEALGPTTVIVKGGAVQKVMEALMELGIVGESQIGE
ncbi:MAG TPA: helicase-associated domain-containing protein [Anaerolineales bacterium]|nr:helicase-associated domain-containing protein [Anaerolineales bacterium]